MNKLILCLFFIAAIVGCKNHDDKKASQKPKNFGTAKEDFDSFFNKFNTQPKFQRSRVVFPFKISMPGDEGGADSTKFIAKTDWAYVNLEKAGEKRGIIRKTFMNKNKVKVVYMVEDTGIEVDHYFLNKDGKWWLCQQPI